MAILTENAEKVLQKRYYMKDENGTPIENSTDMFRRVAHAVAQAEKLYTDDDCEVKVWENKFFDMMDNLEFLPNSPTLMNAGRPLGQLSACFSLPLENDINQILKTVKDTALIHKSGGGTGFNFSKIKLPKVFPSTYKPRFAIMEDHSDVELLKNGEEFSHAVLSFLTKESVLADISCSNKEDRILVIEDNMESIFDLEKLLDLPDVIVFSKVRASKSKVNSTGGEASGPASFMKVWNEAIKFLSNDITPITAIKLFNMCTEVVKQGGTR